MTFIIFWAAVLAILFFILTFIFKGLSSIFESITEALGTVILLGMYGGMIAGVLFIIYLIGNAIAADELKYLGLGIVILLVTIIVLVGIVVAFFGAVVALIISIIHSIRYLLISIVLWTATILETIGDYCEIAYKFFLSIIMNQLQKN